MSAAYGPSDPADSHFNLDPDSAAVRASMMRAADRQRQQRESAYFSRMDALLRNGYTLRPPA